MKKKLIALGIVTFFFSAYSMETYFFETINLNYHQDTKTLPIYDQNRHGHPAIPQDNPIFNDEGLSVVFTYLKFCNEDSPEKKEKLLQVLRDIKEKRTHYTFKSDRQGFFIHITRFQEPKSLTNIINELEYPKLDVSEIDHKSLSDALRQEKQGIEEENKTN